MGINGRNKGNSFERWLAIRLRSIFKDIQTSRLTNRKADFEGVDFTSTKPYAIQAKATERTPSFFDVLNKIPQHYGIPVVIWKKNHKGVLVVMRLEDWENLIDNQINSNNDN